MQIQRTTFSYIHRTWSKEKKKKKKDTADLISLLRCFKLWFSGARIHEWLNYQGQHREDTSLIP